MISHKHKCIFIHIPKCAGTSIETAFGIYPRDISTKQNSMLFGWDNKNKIYLQHATPQQLLDYKIISKEIWDSYYKFIVIRNPWQRAVSSYNWIYYKAGYRDNFYNYLNKKGEFFSVLNDRSNDSFRGDHLTPQKDYLYLDSKKIKYDTVIDFEDIDSGLKKVIKDLNLNSDAFKSKKNVSHKKVIFSYHFNNKNRRLFDLLYEDDI